MATLTIPSPIGGTFDIVIKDSLGATVYAGTQGSAPFDPGITDPGEYTVYVNLDGNVTGFCFTILPCSCPIPYDVEITSNEDNTLRFATMLFSIDPDTFCPFYMHVGYGDETSSIFYYIGVSGLAMLTLISPGVYRYTMTLTPTSTFFSVQSSLNPFGADGGQVCGDAQMLFFECISPESAIGNISVVEDQDSSDVYLRMGFQSHCDDATCTEITVNYLQMGSGSPDSGSYTFTPDCSNFPSITYNDLLLSPNPSLPNKYKITVTGCCGILLSNAIINCSGPSLSSFVNSIVKIGADYFLRIIVPGCGISCHTFHGSAHQLGTSGDSITMPVTTIDCSGSFPQQFDFLLSPNLAIGYITYSLVITSCCGGGVAPVITYTP